MNAVVMAQLAIEPAVAFIRAFPVNPLKLVLQALVLRSSPAKLTGRPFVIGRAGHMEQSAGLFNRIPLFGVCFPDRRIDRLLSYLR